VHFSQVAIPKYLITKSIIWSEKNKDVSNTDSLVFLFSESDTFPKVEHMDYSMMQGKFFVAAYSKKKKYVKYFYKSILHSLSCLIEV